MSDQLFFFACEDAPEHARHREAIWRRGKCPVDPTEEPCPMVGCRWHCYEVGVLDLRRSAESVAEHVMHMEHTCMRTLLAEHPDGAPVEVLVQLTGLKAQTLRDIEHAAFASGAFDEAIERVEESMDDDLPESSRAMVLRELLKC